MKLCCITVGALDGKCPAQWSDLKTKAGYLRRLKKCPWRKLQEFYWKKD